MNRNISIGLAVIGMGILANLLFGGRTDNEADIPQLIKNGALVVDTRTAEEFAGGHIEGALNIPYDVIVPMMNQCAPDKSQNIIVYCHSGGRSAAARTSLTQAGYTHVINAGGYQYLSKLLAP